MTNPVETYNQPITVRKSEDRGKVDMGWLQSSHTFSFGEYYDPRHMGFRTLRVINQDFVQSGAGFPTHPHRDMEIFSYVVEGQIAHKDSMGNGRTLKPGEIQLMSAGKGITHSEYNPSDAERLQLLQIWIQPEERGLSPSYTEWKPSSEANQADKILVISPDGRDQSATIHQDAFVYRVRLDEGEQTVHKLKPGRGLWLQVIHGQVQLNTTELQPGDGASAEEGGSYLIKAVQGSEALLFDLK